MTVPQASPAPLIGRCLSSLLHDEGIQTQSVCNGCFFCFRRDTDHEQNRHARTHFSAGQLLRYSVFVWEKWMTRVKIGCRVHHSQTHQRMRHLYNIKCWCRITQLELWIRLFSIFRLKTGPIPHCWVYPSVTSTGSARAECQHVI